MLSKQFRFEPWPDALCCVLGQETVYSHSASLHPGVYMGMGERNAGGLPYLPCDGLGIPSREE